MVRHKGEMETFVRLIARMTPYTIDASDDCLEDCVATMNRLIRMAKELQPPCDDGLFGDHRQMDLADRKDLKPGSKP